MKVLKYKRGQIWWYKMASSFDGSVQGKTRPVIIISNDLANANSKCLIGIPCTTSIKRYMPTHVSIDINGTPSTVLAENMTSLNIERLSEYIGVLDTELLEKVENCVKIAIGLESVNDIKKTAIHQIKVVDNDCESDKKSSLELEKVNVEEIKVESRHIKRMSDEEKLKFLYDYESNDKDYMLKKYNIKNYPCLRQKVYDIRKHFGMGVRGK